MRHWRTALRVASAVAVIVLFWSVWWQLERQITWYLAVDQFGYLTFAHDLLHGHVFHHWPPLDALGPRIPQRTDVLVQTYVRNGDLLYCRYAPGFPIVLAAWLAVFGDDGANYLNPTLFLAFLAVAFAFQWRVFRSPWRAAAGTALIVLFPTFMHLWGLTLTRDVSAHLAAFAGLLVLVPTRGRRLGVGRSVGAGLLLGFAACIRPDAVLYLVPGTLIGVVRFVRERPGWRTVLACFLAGGLGALVGVSPALAYNRVATGNAFVPTQGMELSLLPRPAAPAPPAETATPPATEPTTPPAEEGGPRVGYPSFGWRGGTAMPVQGGGLRIEHMATTLPGNWRILVNAYTPFLLGVAAWGGLIAIFRRPVLAAAGLSYCPLAFLLFSCWARPDHRYLFGICTFVPMFIVEGGLGTLDVVRLLWRRRHRALARQVAIVAAVLAAVGTATWGAFGSPSTLPPVVLAFGAVTTAGLAVAALLPQRRVAAIAAPLLALAIIGVKVARENAEATHRAPFQGPAMREARANFAKLVDRNAVVITSEDVGRPAENIAYYSGVADAFYLTDLERWRLPLRTAVSSLILDGWRPYLYLSPNAPETAVLVKSLRDDSFTVDPVADIPPARAMANFVAAPFHRGIRMVLYRVSNPQFESLLQDVIKKR